MGGGEDAATRLETTLDALALSPEDGRRIVTRELRYEPDDVELKTLLEIAQDSDAGGLRRALWSARCSFITSSGTGFASS